METVKWLAHPLSYTTTKIHLFFDREPLGTATGFVLKIADQHFLVTNWHVLSGENPSNGKCLSSVGAKPNRIDFHVTVSTKRSVRGKQTETLYFRPMSFPLYDQGRQIWADSKYPENQNDYAVVPLDAHVPELSQGETTLRAIEGGLVTTSRRRKALRVRKEHLRHLYPGVGSDVFVLGYPRGMAIHGLLPIWKRASIASEPPGSVMLGESICNTVIYVDATTKSGMSGSPVIFLAKPGDRLYSDDGHYVTCEGARPYLVGVYAGQDGVTQEEYELSIGRVWKVGALEYLIFSYMEHVLKQGSSTDIAIGSSTPSRRRRRKR